MPQLHGGHGRVEADVSRGWELNTSSLGGRLREGPSISNAAYSSTVGRPLSLPTSAVGNTGNNELFVTASSLDRGELSFGPLLSSPAATTHVPFSLSGSDQLADMSFGDARSGTLGSSGGQSGTLG